MLVSTAIGYSVRGTHVVELAESKKFDVIALGETMLALAPPPGASLEGCEAVRMDHAGAESNTCVGLARLGFRVAWISRLGADAVGNRIVDALRREGVETRWIRRDDERPTGLMLKDPAAGVRYYRTATGDLSRRPNLALARVHPRLP